MQEGHYVSVDLEPHEDIVSQLHKYGMIAVFDVELPI